MMKIKWLGHSCFLFTSQKGTRLLIDPFDETVGYDLPSVPCDVVASTHDHFDHNHFSCVPGSFEKWTTPGSHAFQDISAKGISTFHDPEQGALRGNNIIFVFEIDGLKVCHCGDLGHSLTPELVQAIGPVDVLLVPVGGVFTVDAQGAKGVVDALKPTVLIPMHYKTPASDMGIGTLDEFLKVEQDYPQEKAGQEVELTEPGNRRMLLMQYSG